jgi:hypothetical protein
VKIIILDTLLFSPSSRPTWLWLQSSADSASGSGAGSLSSNASALHRAAQQQTQTAVSYEAAAAYFADAENANANSAPRHAFTDAQRAIVRVDASRLSCWSRFAFAVFGPPRLSSPALEAERDTFFRVARVPMDYAAPGAMPERILQSIYRALTGDRLPPQRYGAHWCAFLCFAPAGFSFDLLSSRVTAKLFAPPVESLSCCIHSFSPNCTSRHRLDSHLHSASFSISFRTDSMWAN